MNLSTTIHEIRTLVVSQHPLIVIDTVEEERVQSLLISVAAELKIAHFEWSVAHGLARIPGGTPIYGTTDPLQVVRHLSCMTLDGIFHLKDFGKFLETAATARQFRELLDHLSGKRSAVV